MRSVNSVLAIVVLTGVAACEISGAGASGAATASASSSTSAGTGEVSLSGSSGTAQLAGDQVAIKDSTVFINGISYGPVAAGVVVKYTVSAEGRTLRVGGERRTAQR